MPFYSARHRGVAASPGPRGLHDARDASEASGRHPMSEPERLLDGPFPADIADLLRSADAGRPSREEEKQRRVVALAATSAPWAPLQRATALVEPAPQRRLARIASPPWCSSVRSAGERRAFLAARRRRGLDAEGRGRANADPAPISAVDACPSDEADVAAPGRQGRVPSGAQRAPLRGAAGRSPSVAGRRVGAERRGKRRGRAEAHRCGTRGARGAASERAAHSHPALPHGFRRPHFVAEADALEVQALAALGRTTKLARRGSFLQAHPGSPYTQRVRSAALTSAPGE